MAPKTPPMIPGKGGSGKPVKDSDTPAEMARDKKRGITEAMEAQPPKGSTSKPPVIGPKTPTKK